MASTLQLIFKRVGEFFQNIEKKKLIIMVSLAVVVVAAGIVGTVLLNQVHYTVLYSGLEASEAGAIKTVLDGKGVKSKVQGTSTILVPEEKADELRIQLASEGYPSTGLNYNIFAGSSSIGSTDLERRTYQQYQLQENMRATIRRMEKVQDCIVIVNLASESSFVVSEKNSAASVAVQLSLKTGQTLTNTEARTIREFVLKCVPNLKADNISIVDSKMNYYDLSAEGAGGAGGATAATYTASQQQLTEQMKDILGKQVLRVLEPAVGKGNAAVSVNLNLNFDKQTVNKVEFTPPVDGDTNGLVRSSQELYNAVSSSSGVGGVPGTNTNGTGNPAYAAAASPAPSASANPNANYTKTYNYELNQVQTQIDKAQGAVQNLTVAVLVNSAVKGIDGYAGNVKNLVAKAIGIKPDYISVELLPFVANENLSAAAFQQNQQAVDKLSQRKMIVSIIEITVISAAVVIIVLLFLKRSQRAVQGEQRVLAVGAEVGGGVVGLTTDDIIDSDPVKDFDMTDLVMKKSSEAEKIEDLMDRYPETVAQILRTWLAEDN